MCFQGGFLSTYNIISVLCLCCSLKSPRPRKYGERGIAVREMLPPLVVHNLIPHSITTSLSNCNQIALLSGQSHTRFGKHSDLCLFKGIYRAHSPKGVQNNHILIEVGQSISGQSISMMQECKFRQSIRKSAIKILSKNPSAVVHLLTLYHLISTLHRPNLQNKILYNYEFIV